MSEDRTLLPTPRATDGTAGPVSNCPSVVAICDGSANRTARLSEMAAGGLLPPSQDGNTLLPTPTTSDSRGAKQGGAHDENVRVPRLAAAVEVDLPAERERMNLLPTPNAALGRNNHAKGQDPEGRRAAGHSVTLADVACYIERDAGLFDEPEPEHAGALLSTPQSRDWKNESGGKFQTLPRDLKENGVRSDGLFPQPEVESATGLMPTPTSSDGTGGGMRTNLSWENTTKATGEGGTSRLRDVVGLLGPDLLPTPRSRDHKGPTASRSGDNKYDLPSALLPTPAARDGLPAKTEETMQRQADRGYGPNLNDVATNYLPTPKARDWVGHGPSSMERNMPDLNAISRMLTEGEEVDVDEDDLGEAPVEDKLLPTPNAADGNGRGADNARTNRVRAGTDDLVTAATKAANTSWGKYEAAIRCWERVTRPAPPPTEINKNGNPRLAAGFSEWLMGWPEGHVTDPEIGISRNDQLRITGNGVVPQQAAHALRLLLKVAHDNR